MNPSHPIPEVLWPIAKTARTLKKESSALDASFKIVKEAANGEARLLSQEPRNESVAFDFHETEIA